MKRLHRPTLAIAAALALASLAPVIQAQFFTWTTVVNNANDIPACGAITGTRKFNSYSQPSVNEYGLVAFRGRSRGSDSGEEATVLEAAAAPPDVGRPARGVYARDMRTGTPVSVVACVTGTVPQPNNTDYNGALAVFNEFPAFPRIDASSPAIATRGQSQPVWEYQIGIDEEGNALTTRVGTSGVYTNPGGVLVTGASLVGAVTNYPSMSLTFPQHAVPGAPGGTRFDQFPGGPTVAAGTVVGFKGNFTIGDIGHTGVFFRDVSGATNPTYLVANSLTRIPNQPTGGTVNFGSTAPPSAAGDYLYFIGSDIEDAPTLGGLYRAKMKEKEAQKLETLVGIGAHVPGEATGVGFTKFGEGLSVTSDANFVAFWGTWGTDTFSKTLYCPTDGNADLLEYCNETYPYGYEVAVPKHQGVFVYDVKKKEVRAVAKSDQNGQDDPDGLEDFLYWVFSGAPPGVGGGEEEEGQEEPRWRSSAFAAVSLTEKKAYAVAFKATQSGTPGIFLRKGTAPLVTVVKTLTSGQLIDPMAPANSIVTAVGIERDGFRGANLGITASMLYETVEESLGWAGIYLTQVPLND